jgi:hypothetical protein
LNEEPTSGHDLVRAVQDETGAITRASLRSAGWQLFQIGDSFVSLDFGGIEREIRKRRDDEPRFHVRPPDGPCIPLDPAEWECVADWGGREERPENIVDFRAVPRGTAKGDCA